MNKLNKEMEDMLNAAKISQIPSSLHSPAIPLTFNSNSGLTSLVRSSCLWHRYIWYSCKGYRSYWII